ncbi:MAG: queuine tRNA-ribosyltransferase family protein [Candidatus Pacebacteria bacterium]|nr:queuine tRNA-ribosyltransferase family protein [Candidatus Paceibacterota bacterium]
MNSKTHIKILGQDYALPIYLPDATLGVVRGLDSKAVANTGIRGVVINTYHLMTSPGTAVLDQVGGIKKFMNWQGLTASDSGGFQLFSLIHKNPKIGKITDEGVVLYTGEKQQRKTLFTPEDSIRIQFSIQSDIMICLDDFSPIDASAKRLRESIERTINWAERCKLEFTKQCQQRGYTEQNRPLLLGVVQGHNNYKLRKECAQRLEAIGFDGYGLGGWPFKEDGSFDYEMCQVTADVTPDEKLKFALGIGSPANIVQLRKMGYDIFDCVLPTRDARHQRLYTFTKKIADIDFNQDENWYEYLYINRGIFKTDDQPLDSNCRCHTCQNYSRAYLHHLFKVKDNLAFQLATTHNLHFYAQLIDHLKEV